MDVVELSDVFVLINRRIVSRESYRVMAEPSTFSLTLFGLLLILLARLARAKPLLRIRQIVPPSRRKRKVVEELARIEAPSATASADQGN